MATDTLQTALSPTAASDPTATPAPMTSAPFVGMLSGDEASQPGPATAETTLGESLEATAEQAWHDLPLRAMERSNLRNFGQAVFDPDMPVQPGTGLEFDQGAPTSPEDANAVNKAAGATLTPFSHPVGANTLQSMIDDNLASQKRADVIQRSAAGIIATPARFAAGALVSLVDPLNDTAMMIPGAPEAWAARAIESAGSGILARIGVRAGVGVLQGAAGMAALQPLAAAQASQDHADYGWGDALRQIAFGAALGAGGGALHGLLGRPEATEAVMKGALSRVMEDHPQGVDIQGVLDHADATDAADRLTKWQSQQAAIDAARPGELSPDTTVLDRDQAIAAHEERLTSLREQSVQFFREAEAERTSRVGTDYQDQHFGRLDAINARLNEGIPLLERQQLEAEKAQIEAGGTEAAALEHQRSVTVEAGLRSASAQATANARGLEGFIERLRAGEADAIEQANANRASADRATRIKQLTLDSREDVLQSLMEKEVRRYAAKVGVGLKPGEAETAAREVRTAGPGEVQDTIAAHLNAIARNSDAFPVRDSLARLSDTTGALRREALGAATDMAARIQNPGDPELDRAHEALARTAAAAPKLEGDVSKDTTEAMQSAADRKAEYDDLVASGQAHELPSLEAAGKDYDEFAKGIETFAKTCGYGE